MRKIPTILTALILTIFYSTSVSAQWTANEPLAADEVQPVFRGGGEATFADWVKKQVMYSSDGRFLNKVDLIKLSFTVDQNGNISDISGQALVDPKMIDEVIKVIGKAPKMTPGTRNGEPAEFRLTADIKFNAGLKEKSPKLENNMPKPNKKGSEEIEELSPCFTKSCNPNKAYADDTALRQWITKKIYGKYTRNARAVVSFVVNKGGYLENIEVMESSSQLFERMIVQTMYECPKWYSPGLNNGEPVDVMFTLPITIKSR